MIFTVFLFHFKLLLSLLNYLNWIVCPFPVTELTNSIQQAALILVYQQ